VTSKCFKCFTQKKVTVWRRPKSSKGTDVQFGGEQFLWKKGAKNADKIGIVKITLPQNINRKRDRILQ